MITRRRASRRWRLAPVRLAPVVALLLAAVVPGAAVVPRAVVPAAAVVPSPSPGPTSQAPANPPASGTQVRWSVAPSNAKGPDGRTRYSYQGVRPGAVVTDYVSITNRSSTAVTFKVYAADGITTPDGSIGLATADVKPTDLGAWTRVAHTSVQVPAGERVIERFTIGVPVNATPGDHAGGLIASIVGKSADGSVAQETRFAVAAYLRVAGPLVATLGIESVSTSYHGTANPFGGGSANVAYTVRNTGNVRLSGTQTVSITGPFGTEATLHPTMLEELLPGDAVRVTARLAGVMPAGPLKAHVTVLPAQVPGAPDISTALKPAARTAGLWATPWPQITLFLILVATAVGLWWWLGWSRRRFNERVAAAVEQHRREATAGQAGDASVEEDGLDVLFGQDREAEAEFVPVVPASNGAGPAGSDRAGEPAPPAAPEQE